MERSRDIPASEKGDKLEKMKVWMNFYVGGQEFKKNNTPHGLQFSNETLILSRPILLPNDPFQALASSIRWLP